jgi:hypothetical protein
VPPLLAKAAGMAAPARARANTVLRNNMIKLL